MTSALDLLIRSDRMVTPLGIGAYDVGVQDGRIVALAGHGTLPLPEGCRLIDATGKIVIPGGIDLHVHCSWPMPGLEGVPAKLTEPPAVVSHAALFGGTTTLIDFARASLGRDVQDAIEQRDAEWRGACHCDYAFHTMVEGALPLELPGQLAKSIQAGHPTIRQARRMADEILSGPAL